MTHKARQIAEYCLSVDAIDQAVAREVGRRVLDSIGCAIGAWREPVARSLVAIGESALPGSGAGAQIFGRSTYGMLEWAAFANAGMVRALDFNDTYLSREPAHPSDNIAPLLAVAQSHDGDGAAFVRAVALAYEIQCRLCDATALRPHGIDHVVFGNFSVAAPAGLLVGFDASEITHALGIAGASGIALRQTREGHMANWKAAAFGNVARNALFAVRAVQAGMTGPNPIFEGARGIESCLTGEFELELPAPGESPRKILDTYIKPYPVEYHAQTAVEAAIELHRQLAERGASHDAVDVIEVRTSRPAYEIIGRSHEKWAPQSRETADHSLPYCVAIAMRDGRVACDSLDEVNYRDAALLALMNRIVVVVDDAMTADYGASFPTEIRAKLSSGETLAACVENALGHPTRPMSDEQLEAKFRTLSEGVIRRAEQDRIIEQCHSLQSLDSRALARLLPLIPD